MVVAVVILAAHQIVRRRTKATDDDNNNDAASSSDVVGIFVDVVVDDLDASNVHLGWRSFFCILIPFAHSALGGSCLSWQWRRKASQRLRIVSVFSNLESCRYFFCWRARGELI